MKVRWTLEKISKGRGFIHFEHSGAYQFCFLKNGKLWLAGEVLDLVPRTENEQAPPLSTFLANSANAKTPLLNALAGKHWTQTIASIKEDSRYGGTSSLPSELVFERDGTASVRCTKERRGALLNSRRPQSAAKLLWCDESADGHNRLTFFDVWGQKVDYPGSCGSEIEVRLIDQGIAVSVSIGQKSEYWQYFKLQ
jgi:hypothetical protein